MRTSLIDNPDAEVVEAPVVVPIVDVPVVEVPLIEVDCRLAEEVRSISEPRPRTTPTNCVLAVLVPNVSCRDTETEQSELTL